MSNSNLQKAKKEKNDEFYTQYADIQEELNHYYDFNRDFLRGKTVLCPCDDPTWSNFTKFFALNAKRYGIKKLISTSYAPKAKEKNSSQEFFGDLWNYEGQLSLSKEDDKEQYNGKCYVWNFDNVEEANENNYLSLCHATYLEGDGDFRSEEVCKLRDQADVVITNPPFSLFREFLVWLLNKDFLIIGNLNMVVYKEVFTLLKENKIWLGYNSRAFTFKVPLESTMANTYIEKDEGGQDIKFATFGNICWFTTLDHGKRHQPLQLLTANANKKYSNTNYFTYENWAAINVDKINHIPADYKGVLGVPISIFDRYCADQFKIIDHGEPAILVQTLETEKNNFKSYSSRQLIINGQLCQKTFLRIFIKYTDSWIASHPEDFKGE